MSKVNVEVMKAWINHKITELLGFEDDIVISYCLSQLVPEEALAADVDERKNYLCPKKLAISLTGFVGKQATHFVRELWKLLLSAQNTPTGIPPEFLENRRLEMERKREELHMIAAEVGAALGLAVEAAVLGATGMKDEGADGEASLAACRVHRAEAGTGTVIVVVVGQAIVIKLR
ncbi:PWI domain-containing protein, putative [Eimeria praecox]|uniref:PWI domain-containing protein, putative n=1 Tax=Eimeria praecox TaxID=51316 RepID=U6H3K5_9EIME|nr:PWI domain-containing protein, putative [Eimeria praecox]